MGGERVAAAAAAAAADGEHQECEQCRLRNPRPTSQLPHAPAKYISGSFKRRLF